MEVVVVPVVVEVLEVVVVIVAVVIVVEVVILSSSSSGRSKSSGYGSSIFKFAEKHDKTHETDNNMHPYIPNVFPYVVVVVVVV